MFNFVMNMKMAVRNCAFFILFACALIMCLSGCSSRRRILKNDATMQEQLMNENRLESDAAKGLKGDERKIVEEAFEWMGTPYAYGRQDKGVATDCSGMVMLVYEKALGCKLPRNSAKQAEACDEIDHKRVKTGDLVFFITNGGNKINHVGIMIDNTEFIHASSHGVMVSSMETDYYKKHLVKFCRVPCMKH